MLIFLYGENTYDSQKKLSKLKERFLEKDESGVNLIELDGDNLDIVSLKRELETVSFLGDKRLVIIKNLLANKDKQLFDKIIPELENIPEGIILVFYEAGLPDQRLKISKKLKNEAQAQEFKLPENFKLNAWIQNEVISREGDIDQAAINKLAVFVGNDLWQLSNEIDKLIAYCSDEKIKVEDVELLVKAKIDDNVFELTDAFGRRDKSRVLKILHDFSGLGFSPEYLLGMIALQLRNLIQVKDLSDRGVSQPEVQKQTGLHPYVVKKTLEQSRLFDLDRLKIIYRKLAELDERIKRGKIKPEVALDMLTSIL